MIFSLEKNYEDSGETRAVAKDMASLTEELNGLKEDFNASFEIIDVAHISLGEWADPVQEKLEAYFTDVVLKTAQVVKTSTSTAFPFMLGKIASLETQLNALASKQDAYVKMKGEEPPTKITKYYDKNNVETDSLVEGGYSAKKDNPAWDEWDKNMYAATVVMDGMFDDINADFASLAEVSFDATNPSGATTSSGNSGNKDNPPTEESNTENTPVFDQNGGADGRHFSSREDAIVAYMAANPGVSREEAEAMVARRIKNATLFIPPDKVDDVVVAGEQLSEVAAMASGLAEPSEEPQIEITEPEHLGDTDEDGSENYRQGQHTDEVFETTDGQTAERSEDLAISGEIGTDEHGEEELIPESAVGEAHYTTSDGETFTGDITITYTNEGESFQKDESITADSTGEHVADVSTNQVRDYHSDTFGTDNNITDVVVEQGGVVTGKREQITDYDRPGMRFVESSEWSYIIPEPGKPVAEGTIVIDSYDVPVTYKYERNNQGQLIETYTYPTGKSEESRTRVVDEHVYLLRVTDPQGQVKETPIILDSELGNAEFERQYQNAMIDVGWEARAANYGMAEVRDGTNGRDPVIVKNVNDENNEYVYQFEFIWPEDYW